MLAILFCTVAAIGQDTTDIIHPGAIWPDNNGNHIQAHGGGIIQWKGQFYWYGEGRRAGLDSSHRYVACYRSKDLVHWTFLGDALDITKPDTLLGQWVVERPKVYYNAKTKKFVMYMHVDGSVKGVSPNTNVVAYHYARVGVAVSDKPQGPFTFLKTFRPLGHESRDIGQFIDDDGTAYLIFEDRPSKGFRIARLSNDYLSVEKEMCLISERIEGGAIVHYKGLYYVLGSGLTGWAPNPNKYATATSLSGPWSEFKDIAPPETNTYGSQSTMLIKIAGTKATTVIYMGDVWKPKTQWDSRYLWMPLQIGEGRLWLPEPAPFTLNVKTGESKVLAQAKTSSVHAIRGGFQHPSDVARTKLWWFHGETETTREGITADLEAFKREGVGGVVYYDQQHGKGEHALPAFSKEWWDMFRFAAAEAKRLGLTFETHLSNGYVSGGPWITEELSMQRLEATDTLVNGGQHFNSQLPVRKSKSGVVRDVAVIAFPVPEGNWETSMNRLPVVSCNIPQLNAGTILFPKDNKLTAIPAQKPGASVLINLAFNNAFTARSISYRVRPRGKSRTGAMNIPGPPSETFFGAGYVLQPDIGQLEVSDDGITYTKVCDLKPIYESPSWNQKTISFPAVTGKYFRLNLHDWNNPKDAGQEMPFGNVVLSAQAKVDQWEEKAALNSEYIEKDNTPGYAYAAIIDPKKIVNLTAQMNSNGQLEWNVPAGQWVIMRFARVPVGVSTKHGRPNLQGLESDKLSAAASIMQWNSYFKVMCDSLQKMGLPLTGLHMDSHEAGSQNWTAGFENKFKQRRGYDIHTYLPALAGYIVGSKEETSGFLYDMRLTLSDLVSDEYFGTLDSLCRQAGVTFTAQAVGNGLTMVADNFKAKGKVQKPQGEFWAYQTHGSYDVKETSSAAHIYGKAVASAEAFTDMKFSQSLADMKNVADYAYAFGAQEFVVCASAYQPWLNKIPGSTGGGRQYVLNRNNTYWNYSRPFWDYQARCAELMRQGQSVADLCIYLGENAPVKLLAYRLPEIPEGYDFDVCTQDALINRISAKDGRIVLPDGVSYQLLVLERNGDISLEALRKIAALVKEGISVYGSRPAGSGSLHDIAFDKEYQELLNRLWGAEPTGSKAFGRGKMYWGMPLSEALLQQGIQPDARFISGNTPADKLYFAHRRLADADVYFLNNHSKRVFKDTIRLRTNAANAEYWDPVTGLQYALPVTTSGKEGLLLPVVLQPDQSGFIVTYDQSATVPPAKWISGKEQVSAIQGEWKVFFDPKWGGPGEVTFNSLTDWTEHADKGIKYYSGTAVYRKTVLLDTPVAREQVLLRFPKLGSIARIFINGKEVSTVWCSPWEADITSYITKGENTLEIEVVNSLTNRMIGDAALPASERFTYAYPEIASEKDRLVPSGIIDSVLLVHRSK